MRQIDPGDLGGALDLQLDVKPSPLAVAAASRPPRPLPFPPHPQAEYALEGFLSGSGFRLAQHYEAAEVITGYQMPNSYRVEPFDTRAASLEFEEHAGGILAHAARNILPMWRDVDLHARAALGTSPLTLGVKKRPGPFSELTAHGWDGAPFGRVVSRFRFLGNRYELQDMEGRVLARIDRSWFRFFRFDVTDADGRALGTLEKQWAGFFREMYTQADAFHVRVDEGWQDMRARLLLVAATVLIDFVHFESRQSRGGFLGHYLSRRSD